MISIIIPCYNHNDKVKYAIESALSQDYDQPYEIIVVDDGSDEHVKVPSGVRIIRHRNNKGLSHALNTGISNSKGKHFVILAADDKLHKKYLEIMSKEIGNADIISCDFRSDIKIVKCKPGNLGTLKFANCHSYAALVDKRIWELTGGFKTTMNPSHEDWEFWLNAAKNGATWKHVPYPLHFYHRNPKGRDVDAQGKDRLLDGKRMGYHNDLYGDGRGFVGIVIPCYQHEGYLQFAVESCFNQIYPHIKVCVVNDGSVDSKEFEKSISTTYRDKVLFVHQDNMGLSGARNAGLKALQQKWKTEYVLFLDADDTLHPNFVEHTLSVFEDRKYVYSDIQFIGDAYHQYECPEYDGKVLARKHIHACTFLAEWSMYRELLLSRGYAYDETMKSGYEDWEIALAFLKIGWCGKRLPEHLFHYRYHSTGSMRTSAQKINKRLVSDIQNRHPWILDQKEVNMACSTCGGRKVATYTQVNGVSNMSMISIPGIGQVASNTPMLVKYEGSTTSTMTKRGLSGRTYKYSGNPDGTFGPEFMAIAQDYPVFQGPFKKKLLTPEVASELEKAVEPDVVEVKSQDSHRVESTVLDLIGKAEQDAQDKEPEVAVMNLNDLDPDDFTIMNGVGPATAKKLNDAGYHYFEDIAGSAVNELSAKLDVSRDRAESMIKEAEAILETIS